MSGKDPSRSEKVNAVATLIARGKVSGRHAGSLEWADLPAHQSLFVNDIVMTGEETRASLVFRNGDKVQLAPGTLVQIEESLADSLNLLLVRGSMEMTHNGKNIHLSSQNARIKISERLIKIYGEKSLVDVRADSSFVLRRPSPRDAVIDLEAPKVSQRHLAIEEPKVSVDRNEKWNFATPDVIFPNVSTKPSRKDDGFTFEIPRIELTRPKVGTPAEVKHEGKLAVKFSRLPQKEKNEPVPVAPPVEAPPSASGPIGKAPENALPAEQKEESPPLNFEGSGVQPFALRVSPGTGYANLFISDLEGKHLFLGSSLAASVSVSAAWFWKSGWGVSASYHGVSTSFGAPGGATVTQSKYRSGIQIASHYFLSGKFALKGGVGFSQEYFFRPTVDSSIALDNPWIPSLHMGAEFSLLRFGNWNIALDGDFSLNAPGSVTGYTIDWGERGQCEFR